MEQAVQISEDGRRLTGETIQLIDDRQEHHLEIRFSRKRVITRVPAKDKSSEELSTPFVEPTEHR